MHEDRHFMLESLARFIQTYTFAYFMHLRMFSWFKKILVKTCAPSFPKLQLEALWKIFHVKMKFLGYWLTLHLWRDSLQCCHKDSIIILFLDMNCSLLDGSFVKVTNDLKGGTEYIFKSNSTSERDRDMAIVN